MRISAGPLLFLVTAAATVSAAPGREETTGRVSYSNVPARGQSAALATGWVELASATPAKHGREYIEVGASAGTFTQLRLTAASGQPSIRAVRVDYEDGSHRTYQVGKVLGGRRRTIYVDLHGAHALRQIVVITDRGSPGSYLVEANAGDGEDLARMPQRGEPERR
ncbi:MAG TPA: hypothetical protein VFT22_32245 [Kofleriaceae bacterium]|nr:hypothetical protein [Kofleriaceae bacterium]